MDRHCVKIEERPSDFRDLVPVNYSGDCYFDDLGIAYLVVQNPNIMDKWGLTGTKEKIDTEQEEAPLVLSKHNVKLRRINGTIHVNINNMFMGLNKYDSGDHTLYYRCEGPRLPKLIDHKTLYVFSSMEHGNAGLVMTYKYKCSYVNVDQKELEGYSYYGEPLPKYYFTPLKPELIIPKELTHSRPYVGRGVEPAKHCKSSLDAQSYTSSVERALLRLAPPCSGMPKVRTNRVKYPSGWELIEPTLRDLENKMREG
ncbi:hypothetical protein L7F22_064586 [Adiantum nelumboides]|nr:hypothetical protein [Adiantum nelumboides]